MRMRKRQNLAPRMEACRSVWLEDAAYLRGNWRSLMPQARELRLEIGCGKGKFTVETAALEPDVLFVAVERVQEALVLAMEKALSMGLKNVYFLSTPPEDVGQILDKDTVENIYCSDEFEHQWTRSSVASWVRQKLAILPAEQIKAVAEEAVNTTPEPIVTPSPTPTPLPTETPWPTPIITPRATPRQEAPTETNPNDPILFVFAGVIVGVIAGIVVVSRQAKKAQKHSRSKK